MELNNNKKIVVSGVQPTGASHIGNYAGAYKNWLELQNRPDLECFFFLADYHSITEDYDPQKKRQQVFNTAAELLALGIDPKKCTFFLQSDVPEHTELGWIFNTITPISFLERMTQFKDKANRQSKNINMGLFGYPVLQAADICMYKGNLIPVGQDQIQHVELTRDIARFFNNKFEKYFPEAKPLLTETPKIMALNDPTKKMSKSDPKSFVGIFEEDEVINSKFKKAVTSTFKIKLTASGTVEIVAIHEGPTTKKFEGCALGAENLLSIFEVVGGDRLKTFGEQDIIENSQLKEKVSAQFIKYFSEKKKKYEDFQKNPEKVWSALAEGAEKARVIAKQTMNEVRKIIGIR